MAEKTLEELKAENAAEEQEDLETTQVDDEPELETEADKPEVELDEAGELIEVDADAEAVEDWMKSDTDDDDDGGQPSGGQFDDSDMAKARRKYKAKLTKKDDELEAAKREIEELKKPRAPAQELHEPQRDDFETDLDFTNAVIDYRFKKTQAENQAASQAEQRRTEFQNRQAKVSKAVDNHYERAVKLAEESGITPEMYQSADFKVRSMVEGIFNPDGRNKGAGDAVVDALIANLGEGSEKVMYNLGRNKSRLQELANRFADDRSGVSASMYIGQLNAELSAPKKRTTNAPKPAAQVQGDKQVKAQTKALKNAYDKADKAGDAQARFNARREARKAGVDTSNW